VPSFLNSGTQGDRRGCLGGALAYPRLIWNGAYHATKAALARLRSGSTCSASFRNGYDCTARIEHLSFARTSSRELVAKRLALLRELVPSTTRVAVLVNPADAASEVLRGHRLEHIIIFGEAHLRSPQWPKSRASKRRSWFVAIKFNVLSRKLHPCAALQPGSTARLFL
jgi:hypothetical protein